MMGVGGKSVTAEVTDDIRLCVRHILRAHNKNKSKPAVRCLVSEECHCDDKLESWEAPTAVLDDDDTSCISNFSSASASRPAEPTVLS